MTDIPFSRMDKATTKSWVKSAWRSCQTFGLHIEDSLPKPRLKRQGDCFLMQMFCDGPSVTNSDMRLLQACNECSWEWKHCQDIVWACGTHILASAYQGIPVEANLHNYIWPRRPNKLNGKHLRKWQLTLDKLVANPHQPSQRIDPTPGHMEARHQPSIGSGSWIPQLPHCGTVRVLSSLLTLQHEETSAQCTTESPTQFRCATDCPQEQFELRCTEPRSKSVTVISTSSQMDPPPPPATVPTTLAEARSALPQRLPMGSVTFVLQG